MVREAAYLRARSTAATLVGERMRAREGEGRGGERVCVAARAGIMRHWVIWRTIQLKRAACRACGHNGASVSVR